MYPRFQESEYISGVYLMKEKNRYFILTMAALANFCYGCAYIWTVFQPEAKLRFGLDTAAANRPFAFFMLSFTLGGVLSGKLQQRIAPRLVVLCSNILMCLGFALTALVPVERPALLILTYGVLSGFGAGSAYNALVALVQKWFPDRRGLVTGITICASGASGLIMTPLCNGCIKSLGFSGAMLAVAGLYFLLGGCAGAFVSAPPEGYMASYRPARVAVSTREYSAGEMIRTRQYYLITFAYMFALPAYFLINPMMKSLGVERGLSEAQAVAGVMAAALLNVAGRLLVPWISDRLGRKPMLVLLFAVNIAAITGLIAAKGVLFMALVVCIAFAYGGYCAIYPVVTADYFGSKNAGLNYGIVMLGCGIVSVLCPFLTSIGNTFSFVTAAVCSVVGIILTLVLKKPE